MMTITKKATEYINNDGVLFDRTPTNVEQEIRHILRTFKSKLDNVIHSWWYTNHEILEILNDINTILAGKTTGKQIESI